MDPNYVAAYSIHEAGVILPGGGHDSQAGVPLSCAFGLHLVNMMTPRMYGEGDALKLNGTRFDMTAYVRAMAQGHDVHEWAAAQQRTAAAAARTEEL